MQLKNKLSFGRNCARLAVLTGVTNFLMFLRCTIFCLFLWLWIWIKKQFIHFRSYCVLTLCKWQCDNVTVSVKRLCRYSTIITINEIFASKIVVVGLCAGLSFFLFYGQIKVVIAIISITIFFTIIRSQGGCHIKNRFLSGIAQITSPPPPPNSGKLYNFFWTSKTTFLCVLQNQVTMITTMMWVIIVIIILVLLMILVLKMTKKYHITWYWCQNIRENMVEKKGKKIRAGVPPPLFQAMPERKHFFLQDQEKTFNFCICLENCMCS